MLYIVYYNIRLTINLGILVMYYENKNASINTSYMLKNNVLILFTKTQ